MSKFIQNWRCIESGFEHGPLNMAIDEMLLLTCARSEITYPVLRFFGFMPDCVTFGISQDYKNSFALKSLSERGKEITRRPTGGGIVLHDFDICYSLVVQTKLHLSFSSAEDSYEAVHQAIYAGFRHEGIEVAFAEQGKQRESDDSKCADDIVKGDLLYKERKIAGGAQRRKDSYLLHQGFVSLKPFAASRAEYYVWFEKMRKAFQEGFKDRFGIQLNTGGLFLDEANEAVRLKNEKYGAPTWNIEGFSSFSALSDAKPLAANVKSEN